MNNSIAFIGGIHGVGKSTICRQICDELKLEYLSASELINWKDINEDSKNKKVIDILYTQVRLINSLENSILNGAYYLLDGHFCLLNSNNEIINVPFDIFKRINPFSINVILGDITEVKKRLELRDKKLYEFELLERLQNEELAYAKFVSEKLDVTLNTGTQNDFSEILTTLGFQMSLKRNIEI